MDDVVARFRLSEDLRERDSSGTSLISDSFIPRKCRRRKLSVSHLDRERGGYGSIGPSRTPDAKLAQHFESMIDVRAACARRLARSGGAGRSRAPDSSRRSRNYRAIRVTQFRSVQLSVNTRKSPLYSSLIERELIRITRPKTD